MDAVDLSGCPRDFAEAYVRHRAAWRDLQMQLAAEPQSFVGGLVQGFLSTLGGEFDGGYSRLTEGRRTKLSALAATWTECEAVATRHGAKLAGR
jgi:hypothetical protein